MKCEQFRSRFRPNMARLQVTDGECCYQTTESIYAYNEKAVTDSRQGVVLHLGGCVGGYKPFTVRRNAVSWTSKKYLEQPNL